MTGGDAAERDAPAARAGFGRGFLPDLWWFAALSSDLAPGALKRVEMLGWPIVLGRTRAGEVYALRDICPHRAAPLSAGRLVQGADGAEAVECPYHGWTFRARDGVCSAIPSLAPGQDLDPSRIRVRRHPAAESQGMVFVWFGADDAEPPAPPPRFEGVAGAKPKLVLTMDFDAHLDHAVIGLMDPAHGPYVHQQWWWRSRVHQHVKEKRFEPREQGFAMARHAPSKNSRAYRILGGAPQTEITFRLPAFRWEHVTVGERQVLALTCLTPLDEGRTRITQLVWSDHWAFTLLRPFVRAAGKRFLEQDGTMVNLQKPGLAHDPALIWIDDADRQAKWYQQLKRAWLRSRETGEPFVNPVEPALLRWRS